MQNTDFFNDDDDATVRRLALEKKKEVEHGILSNDQMDAIEYRIYQNTEGAKELMLEANDPRLVGEVVLIGLHDKILEASVKDACQLVFVLLQKDSGAGIGATVIGPSWDSPFGWYRWVQPEDIQRHTLPPLGDAIENQIRLDPNIVITQADLQPFFEDSVARQIHHDPNTFRAWQEWKARIPIAENASALEIAAPIGQEVQENAPEDV